MSIVYNIFEVRKKQVDVLPSKNQKLNHCQSTVYYTPHASNVGEYIVVILKKIF